MNIGILPSVNFTQQKRGAKPGISVCSRIIRLMNNQTKSRRKSWLSPRKEEKATTRMQWLLWKLNHTWVASRKTRIRWFLKEANSSRDSRCKMSYGSLRKVRYANTSCKYPGKEKVHLLEKYKSKILPQRSPYAMKFEDWSHEETERQQRCARSKAWNLSKNIYKLKEKDQVTFYSPTEEWLLPTASTKELEERQFLVDSGAGMHLVSKRDLNSAELETMRTSRSPTTVKTANGEVQNKRTKNGKRQRMGLIRDGYASWRNSRSSFCGRSSVRIMGFHIPLDQRSKTTSHQKGQENWLQCIKLCASSWSLVSLASSSYNAHTYYLLLTSSSSSQDSAFDVNRYTENPVPERSGSTSEELRGNPGGDQRLRPSTLIRDRPERGEEQEVLRGELGGLSSPTPLQDDSTPDDAEAKNDYWYYRRLHLSPSRGTQSQTVHAERRIIFCSVQVHRHYQNNTYVTGCIVGKTKWLLERRWRKKIFRCMDRLHKIYFIERKATWRIYMVREETDEETNDLKTRQCMARYVEAYVWCS